MITVFSLLKSCISKIQKIFFSNTVNKLSPLVILSSWDVWGENNNPRMSPEQVIRNAEAFRRYQKTGSKLSDEINTQTLHQCWNHMQEHNVYKFVFFVERWVDLGYLRLCFEDNREGVLLGHIILIVVSLIFLLCVFIFRLIFLITPEEVSGFYERCLYRYYFYVITTTALVMGLFIKNFRVDLDNEKPWFWSDFSHFFPRSVIIVMVVVFVLFALRVCDMEYEYYLASWKIYSVLGFYYWMCITNPIALYVKLIAKGYKHHPDVTWIENKGTFTFSIDNLNMFDKAYFIDFVVSLVWMHLFSIAVCVYIKRKFKEEDMLRREKEKEEEKEKALKIKEEERKKWHEFVKECKERDKLFDKEIAERNARYEKAMEDAKNGRSKDEW